MEVNAQSSPGDNGRVLGITNNSYKIKSTTYYRTTNNLQSEVREGETERSLMPTS